MRVSQQLLQTLGQDILTFLEEGGGISLAHDPDHNTIIIAFSSQENVQTVTLSKRELICHPEGVFSGLCDCLTHKGVKQEHKTHYEIWEEQRREWEQDKEESDWVRAQMLRTWGEKL